MTTTHDNEDARASGAAALMGLGAALVWLALVAGVSYYLAL